MHTRDRKIRSHVDIRIVADHSDLATIGPMIRHDCYLAYLVISDHKNEHKPTSRTGSSESANACSTCIIAMKVPAIIRKCSHRLKDILFRVAKSNLGQL